MRRDAFFAIIAAAVVIGSAVGCTRSLRPEVDDGLSGDEAMTAPAPVNPDAESTIAAGSEVQTIDSELITIDAPAPGSSIGSPAVLAGHIDLQPGRLPAAQVLSRSPDGELTRRGNGPIPVDDDGRFEVSIDYFLEVAGPGAVEVVIVDPATGAVTERERMIVELAAAR